MKQDSSNNKSKKSTKKYPWTAKRIAAWAAIILLAGMYVVTLIASMLSSPAADRLFRLSLGMTIAVPIFAWIAIYAVGYLTKKHTIASPDILNSNPAERKKMEDAVRREQEKAAGQRQDKS